MRRFLAVLTIAVVAGFAASASAQGQVRVYGGPISPPLAIPDGTVCGTLGVPVSHTINVPDSGPIMDVDVTLGLSHTWFGDLGVTITHSATTVAFMTLQTPDDSSNLGANYTMDDEAATTFDAAAVAAPLNTSLIPGGAYRPDGLLSAYDGLDKQGDWTITLADGCGADIGNLNNAVLTITNVPEPGTLGLLAGGALALIRRRKA